MGHGSLTVADVLLCRWVLFACLTGIAATPNIYVLGCPGSSIRRILQGFSHLIQKVLGCVLLGLVQVIIR